MRLDGRTAQGPATRLRGRIIERWLGGYGSGAPGALGTSNFPVIDKVVQGAGGVAQEVTSIKSLDLGAASYQGGGAVLSRLTQYITSLANFTGRTWGGETVRVGAGTARVLELAIPARGATPAQLQEISQAVQLAASQGINLVVRVIQ